jgi:hypothetical protein
MNIGFGTHVRFERYYHQSTRKRFGYREIDLAVDAVPVCKDGQGIVIGKRSVILTGYTMQVLDYITDDVATVTASGPRTPVLIVARDAQRAPVLCRPSDVVVIDSNESRYRAALEEIVSRPIPIAITEGGREYCSCVFCGLEWEPDATPLHRTDCLITIAHRALHPEEETSED